MFQIFQDFGFVLSSAVFNELDGGYLVCSLLRRLSSWFVIVYVTNIGRKQIFREIATKWKGLFMTIQKK
jgi:hypothetical protein